MGIVVIFTFTVEMSLITTKVVTLVSVSGEMYLIQLWVIKCINDMRQVGIKLTVRI